MFCAHYYVKPGGNCDLSRRSDPHGEFGGLNVLTARQVGGRLWHAGGASNTSHLLASEPGE